MAVEKVNARDWVVEINTGTPAVPVWTQIGGLTSFSLGHTSEKTPTTDFDSGGRSEHQVMERGGSITIEGRFLEDPANGTRDAGQAAVETLGDAVGNASLGTFRFTSPGNTAKTRKASVDLGDQGGGNNDKTSWSATLEFSGAAA